MFQIVPNKPYRNFLWNYEKMPFCSKKIMRKSDILIISSDYNKRGDRSKCHRNRKIVKFVHLRALKCYKLIRIMSAFFHVTTRLISGTCKKRIPLHKIWVLGKAKACILTDIFAQKCLTTDDLLHLQVLLLLLLVATCIDISLWC